MKTSHRKGLSLEQEYGIQKAKVIRHKLRKAHLGVSLSISHRHSLSLLAQKRKEKQNGAMNTKEAIEKMRIAAIKQFRDPLQREIRRKNRIKYMKKQKRKDTQIELKVEKILKETKHKYVKQFSFDNKYLCDFAIPKKKLIIECDGDYWHNLPGSQESDLKRDKYIKNKGWIVLRFWEHVINKNINVVRNKLLNI